MKKRFLKTIKEWWRKHICSPVPTGYESMFDEYHEEKK